jgi:hypothetical protein
VYITAVPSKKKIGIFLQNLTTLRAIKFHENTFGGSGVAHEEA